MHSRYRPQFLSAFVEQLESRVVLDGTGMGACHVVDFPDSEWVKQEPEGFLRFASLRVGAVFQDGDSVVLPNDTIVDVRGHELSIGQVKEYLHGFADSIGTDSFIETLDLRMSDWGSGSGSTTNRFETYMDEQITAKSDCRLRLSNTVTFSYPSQGGGPFDNGGFLELREEGFSTLLRGGDIAEIVEGYEIKQEGGETILTVDAQLGEMQFVINADHTLTDEFDRTWTPDAEYDLIAPNAVDKVLGDIDGSGTVDFGDFLILSKNFGTAESQGDIDCNGQVAFADFLILSANFGKNV